MNERHETEITRRVAVSATAVAAATLGFVGRFGRSPLPTGTLDSSASSSEGSSVSSAPKSRMPVAFVPHGGGPWPFVDVGFPAAEVANLRAYLESVRLLPHAAPKAILVVSGHWEERLPTVTTSEHPPLLYDYVGFPESAYALSWPAPGHPALAARVRELLGAAGIDSSSTPDRGFDHGAFVPLKLTYPRAEIPTVQLSIMADLDAVAHIALGRALAPLRDEGVFILGSGMSYHNLGGFWDPGAAPDAAAFDGWLHETASQEPSERDRRLDRWWQAPAARRAHPRADHLIPLMVVAGAAGADGATVGFTGTLSGKRITAFHFGTEERG
jgi:aromatic ring-opening dioxygenase catalytic subunit (LigB family)